jgi:hypothetical protein
MIFKAGWLAWKDRTVVVLRIDFIVAVLVGQERIDSGQRQRLKQR